VPSPEIAVKSLLSRAGIAVGGPNPWDIAVHDNRLYRRVLRFQNLGLGEAYMDGWWDCPRLDEFFCRILKLQMNGALPGGFNHLALELLGLLFNLQSRARTPIIAKRHYDLNNELFFSFLDPYIQYSCGYFDGTDDLAEAQRKKLEMICRKLELSSNDRVLDIGCGWGGLSRYMAEMHGCAITAVNISKAQLRYAGEFCRGLPVRLLDCDYRDIQGRFDKIVSVGMFEHVGWRNYRKFMRMVNRCLKDDGIFLLHTIGRNVSTRTCDPWITRYIFPIGMLPSVAQISRSVEGLFVVEDWHNLGPHYDKTLMAWNRNFQDAWPRLQAQFDARFKRMWEYYLLSCAGAFRARSLQVWQLLLTHCGRHQPEIPNTVERYTLKKPLKVKG
jgi:cyclopropane-fatty-acyl-phospholipid synthase